MAHCYDAIVIGAGPAGATAALRLAEGGLAVLLLEKEKLPRDKPCGGGLTPRALSWLPVPVDDLVLHWADRVQARCGSSLVARFRGQQHAIGMVRRRYLDLRLAEEAARRGVKLHDEEAVQGLELAPKARVASNKGSYLARAVIGADGAESHVARWLQLARPRRWMVALDAEFEAADDPLGGEAVVDLGVPYGYAWAFPKGSICNIGLGTFRPVYARELRPRFHRFMMEIGISLAQPPTLVGRRIPTGLAPGPLHRDNALLVGDAAGAADPFFAEGISYAALTGQLAAEAVSDYLAGRSHDLSPYSWRVKATLGADARVWTGIAAVVHRFPALCLRLLAASGRLQALAERTIAGELGACKFAAPYPLC